MNDFLQVCFAWPMWLVCVLVAVIAFWDLLYGAKNFSILTYPRHSKIQLIAYIFCPIIFILWQLSPEFFVLESRAPVLLVRLISIILWYIIARILVYHLFLIFISFIYWCTLGKWPKVKYF